MDEAEGEFYIQLLAEIRKLNKNLARMAEELGIIEECIESLTSAVEKHG
jgi:hypothetical protein